MNLDSLAKALLTIGLATALLGALLLLTRLGVGRLPGDVVWRGERVTVYVPLGLSLVLSVVLTIVLNLLFRR